MILEPSFYHFLSCQSKNPFCAGGIKGVVEERECSRRGEQAAKGKLREG